MAIVLWEYFERKTWCSEKIKTMYGSIEGIMFWIIENYFWDIRLITIEIVDCLEGIVGIKDSIIY